MSIAATNPRFIGTSGQLQSEVRNSSRNWVEQKCKPALFYGTVIRLIPVRLWVGVHILTSKCQSVLVGKTMVDFRITYTLQMST